uniref:Uncharacterized protein n=1 Tax=Opuntia streptacantha TaxID=393608 RepID=A0A7C8ZTT1_OPUST
MRAWVLGANLPTLMKLTFTFSSPKMLPTFPIIPGWSTCRHKMMLPSKLTSTSNEPTLVRYGIPSLTFPSSLISPESEMALANLDSTFASWIWMDSSGLSGEPSRRMRSSVMRSPLCLAVKSAFTRFTKVLEIGSIRPLVIMALRTLVSRSSGALEVV